MGDLLDGLALAARFVFGLDGPRGGIRRAMTVTTIGPDDGSQNRRPARGRRWYGEGMTLAPQS